MKFHKKIERIFADFIDRAKMIYSYHCEKKKFKDKRRKAIYSKIKLTKEQKKEIDVLFKTNYGKKIPYTWHRHYTAVSGKFDAKYFPEYLYVPEFENFMKPDKRYSYVLADKNILPKIAGFAGVKTPKEVLCCNLGIIFKDDKIISLEQAICDIENRGMLFVKPSKESNSGKGCRKINIVNGKDILSGQNAEEILKGMGKNFVIQEVVKCHSQISALHPQSVNTFRIMTYIWKGEVIAIPAIMRMGIGEADVDNAHRGGIFIAVNSDGVLGKTAVTEFNTRYDVHPDTGIVFEGYKIDCFPALVNAAKKMHAFMPQVGVINWDFTADGNGDPLLIEANMQTGSIWFFQMAHGEGAFGDKTEEILRWLKVARKVRRSKRNIYLYGNTEGVNR